MSILPVAMSPAQSPSPRSAASRHSVCAVGDGLAATLHDVLWHEEILTSHAHIVCRRMPTYITYYAHSQSANANKPLYILDARPLMNAGAQKIKGAGFELVWKANCWFRIGLGESSIGVMDLNWYAN